MAGGQGHPDVPQYLAAALWSINERLGGREGTDLPPLGYRWQTELALAVRYRPRRKDSA